MNTKRQERVERANHLIGVIAGCGRRFLSYAGRPSRLEVDARGRVWFHDAYSGKRIYTHYEGRWRGFSGGGTMRDLVRALRDYVVRGLPVPAHHFGPWPAWLCDGDLWAYGEDMRQVRAVAVEVTGGAA